MVFESWDEKTKTVKFDLNKKEDRELWEWLRTLPFGEFTKQTKEHWVKKMKEGKR